MNSKKDWLLAIICSEVIAAGILVVSMLSYYFLNLFMQRGTITMTLETRLISNSNAFFTTQDRTQLVADEYEKQFKIALMQIKKPLPTAISND